ncbi:MAG: hypothetical protein AAF250_00930 [Pseudomonadota bacterium]
MATSILSLAPLPVSLPDYEVECRAGAMTSKEIVHLDVRVSNADGERTATVRTPEGSFSATIETRPIGLSASIGGRGFIDLVEYEIVGKRTVAAISVRGSVEDNIIDFRIAFKEKERGILESTLLTGQCHRTHEQDFSGALQ